MLPEDDFYERVYARQSDTPAYDNLRKAGYSHNEVIDDLKRSWKLYPNYYSVYAGQLPEVTITPDK